MSAGELRMPAAFAWVFFFPGVLFVTVDVVRLNITGLFLLGVVFLVLWLYLLGGFTREFWNGPSQSTVEGATPSDPIASAPSTVSSLEVQR